MKRSSVFHAEFIIVNTEFIIFNTEFIIFKMLNAKLTSRRRSPARRGVPYTCKQREVYQSLAYIYEAERGLSIAGMYIRSRERSINRWHVYTKQKEVYQSLACVYEAERGLSIAGMYIRSRQQRTRTPRLSPHRELSPLGPGSAAARRPRSLPRPASLMKCSSFLIQNSSFLKKEFIIFKYRPRTPAV